MPNPSIASIIGVLLPPLYNPEPVQRRKRPAVFRSRSARHGDGRRAGRLRSAASRRRVHLRRHRRLLYGVKIGLEKAVPGCLQRGLTRAGRRARLRAEPLLLPERGRLAGHRPGQRHRGAHALRQLDRPRRRWSKRPARRSPAGKKIAAIVATMGTTDAFGIDDLRGDRRAARSAGRRVLAALPPAHPRRRRDRLGLERVQRLRLSGQPAGLSRPHRAGAWPRRSIDIGHLRLADSIGIDFHKTGYAPYISSLVLVRDRDDFELIARSARDDAVSVPVGRAPPGHVHAGNHAAAASGRWRRWPTCCCWARKAIARCWATRWRWPKCCAS